MVLRSAVVCKFALVSLTLLYQLHNYFRDSKPIPKIASFQPFPNELFLFPSTPRPKSSGPGFKNHAASCTQTDETLTARRSSNNEFQTLIYAPEHRRPFLCCREDKTGALQTSHISRGGKIQSQYHSCRVKDLLPFLILSHNQAFFSQNDPSFTFDVS